MVVYPRIKPCSVVVHTGEALARDQASAEAQQQQREALATVLLDQKARGEEEYLAGVHRLERQLLLLCTQLAIQNKKAVEEEAFQVCRILPHDNNTALQLSCHIPPYLTLPRTALLKRHVSKHLRRFYLHLTQPRPAAWVVCCRLRCVTGLVHYSPP